MRDDVETHLAHYGIKGMRWGVRRRRGGDNHTVGANPANKVPVSGVFNKSDGSITITKAGGPKKAKHLSDQELRDAVNRMELEKRYKNLAAEANAEKLTKGQKFIRELEGIASSVARTQATRAANAVVSKALDDKLEAAGLIKPSKKKKNKGNP